MNVTINNKPVQVDRAKTVLDVARENNIYIPTLCAHPELTPYGGCRLCIIEVEGRKGYPTACTTLAEEGMVIRTETHALQAMRSDLIQLILSEHPAACLICECMEGCTGFQETIRKVGVTTGCRWCPRDRDCELQKVVDYLGVKELHLPGLYRELPIEKYDPFFDRDYNLCIYCGRCVRICVEYRRSSILSLKQRGKLTTIGPAFEHNHIEAGCEFCGACVSVCPTGAMSEKSKKWWGIPEKSDLSYCPLCSLNCEIEVLTSKSKIIGTSPRGEPHQSGGKLCVKGRFCLSELVNRSPRVLEPEFRYPEGYGIVDWDFAIGKAKEIIEQTSPGRSAVFLSPSLSLEEIFAAGAFAEEVLKTDLVSSSCLTAALTGYMQLDGSDTAPDDIANAEAIVSFFLNGNYRYAPVTMKIKEAAAKGIPYFQAGWIADTTSRFAKKRFITGVDGYLTFLEQLLSAIRKGKSETSEIHDLALVLKKSTRNVFVVGPEIMSLDSSAELLTLIRDIAGITRTSILTLSPFGNLRGLLSLVKLKTMEEVKRKIRDGEIDLLWLMGDSPYQEHPSIKRLVYQNAFPTPAGVKPDLVLPAAIWGEAEGSFHTHDKSGINIPAVAAAHGYARPHVEILTQIATALGMKDGLPAFKKTNGSPLQLPDPAAFTTASETSNRKEKVSSMSDYPFVLIQEKDQHVYFGFSLGLGLEGLGELVKPGKVHINPRDARQLGLSEGETIYLSSCHEEKKYRVTLSKTIEEGFLYLVAARGELEFENNPCPVKIRRDHV
jgi:predicted molibdopterin-dependent oxidoreductase YjgC